MAKVFKDYRKESQMIYGTNIDESENISHEQLRTGAILRIADACETMAKNYIIMQSDLDLYKRLFKETRDSNERLIRRIYALKGVITRIKRKGETNASI